MAVVQYKRFVYKEVLEVSSVNVESLYIETHQIFIADYTQSSSGKLKHFLRIT